MLLQNKQVCSLVTAILMLTSLAFCLEGASKGKLVEVGRLLIGSNRTTNEPKDDLLKKLHEGAAGDTKGYQADQQLAGFPLTQLKLERLRPFVQCDNDSMSLRVQGNRLPNFLVETSDEGLVPLSQMPSHCGFSTKKVRRDISLVADYGGCNVAQQDDAYILPLRVLGVAMKMVCPVARPLTTVSCSPTAMIVNLGMSADAVGLKVNGVSQPLHQASAACGFTVDIVQGGLTLTAPYTSHCWQYEGYEMHLSVQYMNGELTVSCPAVHLPPIMPLPATVNGPPVSPVAHVPMGHPYGMPWHFHRYPLGPPAAPTVAPRPYPWLPETHHPYGMPWRFHGYPLAAPTVAPRPYPWLPGKHHPYGMPWRFHQYPLGLPAAPTVAPRPYPWLPGKHHPYGMPWRFPQYPLGLPAAPTVAPRPYPWFPGTVNPYGMQY